MLGGWILLSILPLLSVAIAFCGKSRETAHTKSDKSSKSKKSGEKTKSGKSAKKSGKSAKKSGKSAKKSGSKSGKSSKSKKSSKSAKSSKSGSNKSKKSTKSSKKGDSQKEKSQKLAKTQVDNSAALKREQDAVTPRVAKPVQECQLYQMRPIEVRAEPQEMSFKSTGGLQSVNIVNNSGERRVFKVKCSDNQLYRVHPVYSVIEAGQSGKIEVLRNNGTSKMDKLILLSVKASDIPSDFKNFFSKIETQEQHMMAVPLVVDA